MKPSQRALAFLLSFSLLLASCATNPATGRSEINFYSDEDEINMGREAHEEIIAEYGVYDEKPELNAMIERIGRRIAASSPRPNLPWTFTLLDTPMVNAMALPGGYIYVTRGILERMNSEDELAGVIGHEVAHVAARHGTHSMSTGTLLQVGLIAATVLAGEENTEKYGIFAMIGAGLLFTKYNRQQETEADILGTRYMAGTGYNPIGSENMLMALQRLGGKPGFLERYFMDHPDPEKRVQDIRKEIGSLAAKDTAIAERTLNRKAFVARLDGMITGNSTTDTTVRDGVVYNRSYGLVAPAPRGWKAVVESGSLFAMYKAEGEEVIYAQGITADELEEFDTPRQAVRAQLEELGLTHDESINGQNQDGDRMTIDLWSGDSEGTEYSVASTQQPVDDGAVVFLHISQGGQSRRSLMNLVKGISIDQEAADAITPPRLKVLTARAGDTWQTLARRASGDTEDADDIAHINGFDFPSAVPAGLVVKLPEEVATPVE